ncbi:MAG: hypothetical protein ACETV1_03310 [Candidatus Bathyarchaeia archaeon]
MVFQWLRDLLTIYTWTELWLIVSVPTAMTGLWFLLSFLLSIPNDAVRTASIWLVISGLTLGAATVDALRKR